MDHGVTAFSAKYINTRARLAVHGSCVLAVRVGSDAAGAKMMDEASEEMNIIKRWWIMAGRLPDIFKVKNSRRPSIFSNENKG
jgi:hypothetical protein